MMGIKVSDSDLCACPSPFRLRTLPPPPRSVLAASRPAVVTPPPSPGALVPTATQAVGGGGVLLSPVGARDRPVIWPTTFANLKDSSISVLY